MEVQAGCIFYHPAITVKVLILTSGLASETSTKSLIPVLLVNVMTENGKFYAVLVALVE